MTRSRAAILVAAATLVGSPGRLRADPPPDPLAECADAAVHALAGNGARLVRSETGFLDETESRSWPVTVGETGCIGLLAVGQRHVQDLDLALHTATGIELGRDIAVDAHPYLRFCGAPGLELVATVRMYRGRGEYRLMAFEQPPEVLPDLNRMVGECFASRIGIHYPAANVGPEPEGPSAEDGLAIIRHELEDLGYRATASLQGGRLQQREVEQRDVTLSGGRCYAIALTGGPGVGDLDLMLRQPDGRPLARDLARARDALVKTCVDQGGVHSAEVRMVQGEGPFLLQVFELGEPPAATRPPNITGETRIPFAEVVARLGARGLDAQPVAWGFLSGGQQLSVPVRLSAGRCYGIGVVPTEAFIHGDLDMVLLDDTGALMAWELGSGPTPIVYHCPDRSGMFHAVTRAYGGRGRFLVVLGGAP